MGQSYHICGILYHKREFPGNPYTEKGLILKVEAYMCMKSLVIIIVFILLHINPIVKKMYCDFSLHISVILKVLTLLLQKMRAKTSIFFLLAEYSYYGSWR